MSQICPKCQSTNIDTAKFCKKCGNALQPSALGGQTLSAIEQRALEEKLYEQVATELKNGQRKEGLYTKALVDANGSEELANVLYIKYAVQSLQDELILKAEEERKTCYHKKPMSEMDRFFNGPNEIDENSTPPKKAMSEMDKFFNEPKKEDQ